MDRKIRVGITQGDINGIGYELILKTFSEPMLMDMCTPIIYGSPKVATFHRKALELNTTFVTIESAEDAVEGKLNLVTCFEEEVKIELGKATQESGAAALIALEYAMQDYENGLIDALVTAPVNAHVMQNDNIHFHGHTEYLEEKLGEGEKALMILLKDQFRVALVTEHIPVKDIASTITKELIMEKATTLFDSLQHDFLINNPRIAVLALNPHAGDENLLGMEETDKIIPAIEELRDNGIQCFGPYAAEGFFGSDNLTKFDAVLAMYHDQALIPFRSLGMYEGVNYTAGLPLIRTAPAHGTGYDIAGKNEADETAFRNAVYAVIDIYRCRRSDDYANRNPLRKLFTAKRDDSDKLKLDEEEAS